MDSPALVAFCGRPGSACRRRWRPWSHHERWFSPWPRVGHRPTASGHCIVMCGGITAAGLATARGAHGRPRVAPLAAYQLGRIASYTLAGLLVGGVLGAAIAWLISRCVTHCAPSSPWAAARRAGRLRPRARSRLRPGPAPVDPPRAAGRRLLPVTSLAGAGLRHALGLDALRLRLHRAADRGGAARCPGAAATMAAVAWAPRPPCWPPRWRNASPVGRRKPARVTLAVLLAGVAHHGRTPGCGRTLAARLAAARFRAADAPRPLTPP